MKKVLIGAILIIATLTFTFSVNSEQKSTMDMTDQYKVINVQGRILFKKSGDDMKRGDTYVAGTLLEFTSNQSRAAIINKISGRFVLTGNSKGKVKVLPAANNISSRSGALLNVVDVKKHFAERYLVLDKSEIQIGSQAFPMDKDHFFYLTYEHKGEEIAKKLSFDEDKLILDKEEIFKIDGESIEVEEKKMTLYYRNDGKGTKINTFTPIFPNMLDLKEEVSLILEMFDNESVDKKINEITAHLIEFYGKPQSDNLNAWLEAEFELKKTK